MDKLRTEHEIIKSWGTEQLQPVVSICCITFNHENYIEEAIKGFLIQETDFPFEILIHDDASTDNTREIVCKYAIAYPNIIKLILQDENQYSKKKFSFIVDVFQACNGKYIALCEGDDFWVDKKKIITQKKFLDLNSEYVVTTSDAFTVYGSDKKVNQSRARNQENFDFSKDDLIKVNYHMPTMNLFFRSHLIPKKDELADVDNFDYFFVSYLGVFGKGYFHKEIEPSYYRIHIDGIWSMKSKDQKINMEMNTMYQMYKFYSKNGMDDYSNVFFERFVKLLFKKLKFAEITFQTFNKIMSILYGYIVNLNKLIKTKKT